MNPPDRTEDESLETFIGRNLKSLPDLSAPPTLIHRVMLAVHEQERLPWWQRSWWTWPMWVRALSLALLVGCAWVVSQVATLAFEGVRLGWLTSAAAEVLEPLRPIYRVLATLVNALLVVCRMSGQQALVLVAAGFGTVYLFTVGLGTACYRLALHRSFRA